MSENVHIDYVNYYDSRFHQDDHRDDHSDLYTDSSEVPEESNRNEIELDIDMSLFAPIFKRLELRRH